ncbi:MAG: hypothetical protein OEV94_11785 [Deltaproteobacteria bacterium]|nr:hypothetical protein [Deltaproteobacteria bacterium]
MNESHKRREFILPDSGMKITLRPPKARDLFDAEEIVPVKQDLTYKAALASRMVQKYNDLPGPLPWEKVCDMSQDDMTALVIAGNDVIQGGAKEGEKKGENPPTKTPENG